MAVFTFIGTAIGGWIAGLAGGYLGSTLIGTAIAYAAGALISGGLAFATAKVLGVFDPPDLGPDPGVKIQLAPSTDNKVGVAYGRNYMSGPITDIAISNGNQTMHYCLTLSESVTGGTYTVNQILRDSAVLNFAAGNATISGQTNTNATSVTNVAGKIRVRVYAGGTAATNQVFPSTGTQVAATTMMPHWTNTTDYSMEELVFAMIEVDYDAENGLTGLGGMTFDITNSISNPGDVLIDYLNNTRYGAGMSNAIIDVNSITGAANTSLKGYSAEQISYTPNTGGSATQDRWQINGYISTFADCSTNIAKIMQASATFWLFDTKQGKFKTLPNRPTASTFSINDTNITSKITVTSTELYALYNAAEVEFNDVNRKDQTNSIKISTPAGELNANEPENVAKFRIDLVNDAIRTSQVANIDLSQSRNGMIVTCTTDYSGMQIDVGDVVDLTNADYGFTAKEFRVMKQEEILTNDNMIRVSLTLLEYNADVYVQPAVTDTDVQAPTDIPTIPDIGLIPIPGVFDGTWGNITLDPSTYGNVIVNDVMKTFGAGTQLTDQPTANTDIISGTTFLEIIPVETYDLIGADLGDYEFTSSAFLGGAPSTAYDVGFSQNVTLSWSNATTTVSNVISGGGVEFENVPATGSPPALTGVAKISIDPADYGYPVGSNLKPVTANVVLRGYSDIAENIPGGFPRSFGQLNYQMLRITKGEKE